jgi:hypothetical protein
LVHYEKAGDLDSIFTYVVRVTSNLHLHDFFVS